MVLETKLKRKVLLWAAAAAVLCLMVGIGLWARSARKPGGASSATTITQPLKTQTTPAAKATTPSAPTVTTLAAMAPKTSASGSARPRPIGTPVPMRVPPGFRAAQNARAEPYTNTGWAKEIIHEKTGIELVLIPAGKFMMGSPEEEEGRRDNEGPQHRVRITKPFYLGKYEVTQGDWEKVMGDNPSQFHTDPELPVENLSWEDCQMFLNRAGDGVRLPTEAEWEYACRADTRTPFHTGDTISVSQANYDGSVAYGKGETGMHRTTTLVVGSFPPNAWGLGDVHGNVAEWCQDWFKAGYYKESLSDDPAGPAQGKERVVRGGSWVDMPKAVRSAKRMGLPPNRQDSTLGFRVAFTPGP